MSDRQPGTVVIGGGQAGLAIGYHLRKRGLPFVVLDENDRIGDAWRKRWDSLRLFTPGRYNGLPGMRFPGPASAYPRKDEAAAYLEWCTGFSQANDWTDVALPARNGVPVSDRGIVESCPGLHFVGLPFLYSLSSALVGGVGRDAGWIADHIARNRV